MYSVLRHSALIVSLICEDRPGTVRMYELNRLPGGKYHERGHLALYGLVELDVWDTVPCVNLRRHQSRHCSC